MLTCGRVIVVAVLVAAACGGDDATTTQPSLLVTQGGTAVVTLATIEGGQPLAIGVSLDGPPPAPLEVTLAAPAAVTLDRATLTFTAGDWDRPQPVVINAVDDVDVIDGAGEIELTAPGYERLVLPIAVADDDELEVVTAPRFLAMEGDTVTAYLHFGSDPGGEVTVTLTSTDPAAATVEPATLVVGADWATPRAVTITATPDADDADELVAIDVGGLHVAPARFSADVLDDERQQLVISETRLALVESGAPGSFTVRLTQPPAGSLTVALTMTDPAIATAAPATLTFDAASFAVPQTVTVTPRVDLDGTFDESALRLSTTGVRERVVAVGVGEDATPDVANATGEFLMAFRFGFAPESDPVRYRVSVILSAEAGWISYFATALRADDGQPIGDQITAVALPLGEDASFTGAFRGDLPGEANPAFGTIYLLDAMLQGRVLDADRLCGTMTGSIGPGQLDGTTWGAVRITGATLPTPLMACP